MLKIQSRFCLTCHSLLVCSRTQREKKRERNIQKQTKSEKERRRKIMSRRIYRRRIAHEECENRDEWLRLKVLICNFSVEGGKNISPRVESAGCSKTKRKSGTVKRKPLTETVNVGVIWVNAGSFVTLNDRVTSPVGTNTVD